VWGYSKEEAIAALKDAAQAYIEVLIEKGQAIPVSRGVETLDAPEEGGMKKQLSVISIDLAKAVFRVVGMDRRGPVVLRKRLSRAVVLPDDTSVPRPPSLWVENPLLRSGLALSGANLRQSGNEDGVLAALEAASLDLGGTKLAVGCRSP
jgi:hypothetical protein